MKNLYIILTYTGTVISKMIKGYTKDEYCHCSIALDEELNQMYSFGRLKPYTPLLAGFVQENIHEGTFKRFYNTKAKIYSMQVTDEQYEKVKNMIERFKKNKSKYKFNMIGLCSAGFNIKIHPKNYFYCAEFVKYILDKAEIETGLPKVVKPEHFKKVESLKEIYTGLLRNYKVDKKDSLKLKINNTYKNKEEVTVV